jgi:hypothetical protein
MSLTHSRDGLNSAVGEDPVRGAPDEQAAPGPLSAAHRVHRLLWILVCCFLCLVVAVLLLLRQAVQHKLVETDLDTAAAAFDDARRAQAHDRAPEAWGKATNAMTAAMSELHRQQGRFVLVRGYPRVHELLVAAIGAAAEAKSAAEAEKAREETHARRSSSEGAAHAAIDAAKASLDHAFRLSARIQACPRAKRARDARIALETLRGRLDSYRERVADMDAKYAYEDYGAAQRQAETLKESVDPLCKDLEGILVKFTCK